jgi:2-haloacid dehalogenase
MQRLSNYLEHEYRDDGVDRRGFLKCIPRHLVGAMVGGALVATDARAGASGGSPHSRDADAMGVLFDALALFDARPAAVAAEEVFPARGAELMASWRTRQFEYAWLRVVTGQYADFWRCTEDALRYSASALGLVLTPVHRRRLMQAHLELRPWPDVQPVLETLNDTGARIGLLSNFSPSMLEAVIRGSGLDGQLEHVISTHEVRSYKPDPRAYQLGIETLRLARERICFVAFAGWDAAGAKLFGYPTFWVNRFQAPFEELGAPVPDGSGRSLSELPAFLSAVARRRPA